MRIVILLLLLAGPTYAKKLTWSQAQKEPAYLEARKSLALFLPEMAIPRLKTLLDESDLDQKARANLLTLLGEAQVRAKQPKEAIATLSHADLKEWSPAHRWRAFAQTQLGYYQKAIDDLRLIDRRSMRDDANLQIGLLQAALGQDQAALATLRALTSSENPTIAKSARFKIAGLLVALDKPDDAQKILRKIAPDGLAEESLQRYLQGKINLLRKERIPAVGEFQTLVDTDIETLKVPANIYHEATLALADSLALEENYQAGLDSLLSTLDKHPRSPVIAQLFARLTTWSDQVDPTPILQKLATWIPKSPSDPSPAQLGPKAKNSARSLHSLLFLASANLSSDNADQQALGRRQIDQLQLLANPTFPALLQRSFMELGAAALRQNQPAKAAEHYRQLAEIATTPQQKAQAMILAGQSAFAAENPQAASKAFQTARDLAAQAGQEAIVETAALNAGIALLTSSDSAQLNQLTDSLSDPQARAFLLLERGVQLIRRRDPSARTLLTRLLQTYPENPRRQEALLALAEASLLTPENIDREALSKQLLALQFDRKDQLDLHARKILTLLQLDAGLDLAKDFHAQHSQHPLHPEVLFELGKAYRRSSSIGIGEAYILFEQFLEKYPNHYLTDPARYLSALSGMASSESGVAQALNHLDTLAASKSPLAQEAAYERASLLVDQDQQELALTEINTLLKNKKLPSHDQRRLLVLAADAAGQLNQLTKALSYYDQLLGMTDLPAAWRNRAHYYQGLTHEKLDQKSKALEAYFAVINRQFDPEKASSLEWEWFDKAGLDGALKLLEKEEKWEAAIQLAHTLSKSGSPRAADAAAAADRISLQQMIWRR